MKSFWWYQENSIAGMARPGFNSYHWYDLSFNESIVMGWLGQYSSGPLSLESFREHAKSYVPKVFPFYKLNEKDLPQILGDLQDPRFLESILIRLVERAKVLMNVSIAEDRIHFEIDKNYLESEMQFLKDRGINRIVTLTEEHHLNEELSAHFDLDHISIVDMSAPTEDQAYQLAQIFEDAEKKGERLAVHCLAGIGRTSTMIMAAEMMRGKSLDSLLLQIQKQNPFFSFKGPQAEFIKNLNFKLNQVQVVGAIIRDGSKFLLGKRSSSKNSCPGIWSPICGRIELNESQSSAVERECLEEVGLVVRARQKVAEIELGNGASKLHWWLVESLSGTACLMNDEHSELRWFTIDEMKAEPGFPKEYIQIYENFGISEP
jgi:8-oxo-dGTP pyrophosphatase MutT (NUDIX family)